jgi:hypothetical protein
MGHEVREYNGPGYEREPISSHRFQVGVVQSLVGAAFRRRGHFFLLQRTAWRV